MSQRGIVASGEVVFLASRGEFLSGKALLLAPTRASVAAHLRVQHALSQSWRRWHALQMNAYVQDFIDDLCPYTELLRSAASTSPKGGYLVVRTQEEWLFIEIKGRNTLTEIPSQPY